MLNILFQGKESPANSIYSPNQILRCALQFFVFVTNNSELFDTAFSLNLPNLTIFFKTVLDGGIVWWRKQLAKILWHCLFTFSVKDFYSMSIFSYFIIQIWSLFEILKCLAVPGTHHCYLRMGNQRRFTDSCPAQLQPSTAAAKHSYCPVQLLLSRAAILHSCCPAQLMLSTAAAQHSGCLVQQLPGTAAVLHSSCLAQLLLSYPAQLLSITAAV